MSFHYWRNVGRTAKRRFITLSNSYHGETLGALAVGDVELYKADLPAAAHGRACRRLPGLLCARAGRDLGGAFGARNLGSWKQALARHHAETAAVIVEPLVQCAGGMRMYDPVYLSLLREACDRYGVHLIADEVAVGFGRTGTLFACEQAQIRPDFIVSVQGADRRLSAAVGGDDDR